MKTWAERLDGIIAFIESGNGLAKIKAKKELEEMAVLADFAKNIKKIIDWTCEKCGTFSISCEDDGYWCYKCEKFYSDERKKEKL